MNAILRTLETFPSRLWRHGASAIASAKAKIEADRLAQSYAFLILRELRESDGRPISGDAASLLLRNLDSLGSDAARAAWAAPSWLWRAQVKSDDLTPTDFLATPAMALCLTLNPEMISAFAPMIPREGWLSRVEFSRLFWTPKALEKLSEDTPAFRSVGPLGILCAASRGDSAIQAARDWLPSPVDSLELIARRKLVEGKPFAAELESILQERAIEAALAAPETLPRSAPRKSL